MKTVLPQIIVAVSMYGAGCAVRQRDFSALVDFFVVALCTGVLSGAFGRL